MSKYITFDNINKAISKFHANSKLSINIMLLHPKSLKKLKREVEGLSNIKFEKNGIFYIYGIRVFRSIDVKKDEIIIISK